MRARLAAALLAAAAVAGCTISTEHGGGLLTPAQLERLAASGTKAEVLERVGPPVDVGLQLDGSVFIYRSRREELENLNLSFFQVTFDYETIDRRTDRLVVFFDKTGRKTGYGLDTATGRIEVD